MARLDSPDLPEPKQDIFGSIDPLDSRYYDKEISRYLSERSRIAYQVHVEAVLAKTLANFGICSPEIAQEIYDASRKITAEQVRQEEKITKHDIKAIVNSIKSLISNEAKPYVHFGATSYDIIVNASVLQYRAAVEELVAPRLNKLLATLIDITEKYSDTPQIGRTHGQHALPITFGFAMAEYVDRLGNNIAAVKELARALPGKFSGAVGAYNALGIFVDDPIKFENTLLGYLDIKPSNYSNQIIPPEYMIRLIDELAITSGIMANLSHDMRHLQRSEIAEIRERFEPGQTGSSTMAHKRNPWNFENVISMSKQVTSQIVNANLNVSSEHQRDLTDSASSRFYPIVFAAVANSADRLNKVMSKIEIDEQNMKQNLQLTKGAIAAEPLYLLLEKYGHITAHEKAKELSQEAMKHNHKLTDYLKTNREANEYWNKFSEKEKQIIENPEMNYVGLASKRARTIAKKWRKSY